MGSSESKEFKEIVEILKTDDWKTMYKKNPEFVKHLPQWVKKYGFNGRLQSTSILALQRGIRVKGGTKKGQEKLGWEASMEWLKEAQKREEGERKRKAEKEAERTENEKKKGREK